MPADLRVCLDLLGAQEGWTADRGIGRYIVEHAGALLDRGPEDRYSLRLHTDGALGPGVMGLATRAPAGYDQPERLPDVLHVMSPFAEQPLHRVWPAWARDARVATVVTLYDVIPLRFPERYLVDPAHAHAYRARLDLVRGAGRILAISERTAEDAVELLGARRDRITVINAGASTRFAELWPDRPAAAEAVRARWPQLADPFLFYVGGNEPRKNIEGLFRAVAALPGALAHIRLVVTCALTPAYEEHLLRELDAAGVPRERVVLTGHVTDRELAALYTTCALFVFPSFYEGSGLPLLEAMSCGAPAIASRTATGPELLGSDDGTFDPSDPAEITAQIAASVSDPERTERLRQRSLDRAAHYRWSGVAERSEEAYAAAAAKRRPSHRPARARKRVAIVSPAPPERSGIATYTAELSRALSEHVDVEVVVDPSQGPHPALGPAAASIVDVGSYRMRSELGRYDRTLYCMGNSAFHGHVYDAFLERPDVVVLHDVRITQFFRYYGFFRRRDNDYFINQLLRLYGDAIPPDVLARRDVTREETDRLGIFMTGELQALASRVIVHSRFAAEIARLDRRGRPAAGEIDVLPLACPAVRERRGGGGRDIVSLGYVDEIKETTSLLFAMAELVRHVPDATLTFVGSAADEDLARWTAMCQELGLTEAVRFTGFATDAQYWDAIDGADLAVQLRTMTNGEASAAVTDCLAAGLPTIVTDLGWSGELPAGTVTTVDREPAPHRLAETMRALLEDEPRRAALSAEAVEYARRTSFPEVARAYLEQLEL